MPTLPASLPIHFGGYSPPPGLVSLEGTELSWIESHCDEALGLLLHQFRNKPRLEAVICGLLAGVQDLDDATWQVLVGRMIANAAGVQLNGIGQIVDLPRAGWPDPTYRALLLAKILVLRSSGTSLDLVKILVALGYTKGLLIVADAGMAAVRVVVGDALGLPDETFAFLEAARAAGVRLTFEYPTDDAAFTFSNSTDAAPSSFTISPTDLGPSTTVHASGLVFVGHDDAPRVGDTLTDQLPVTATITSVTELPGSVYVLEVSAALETGNDLTYSYSTLYDGELGYGSVNDAALGGAWAGVKTASAEL